MPQRSKHNDFEMNEEFIMVKEIFPNPGLSSTEKSKIKIPNDILLADPNFHEEKKVDLLFGGGAVAASGVEQE